MIAEPPRQSFQAALGTSVSASSIHLRSRFLLVALLLDESRLPFLSLSTVSTEASSSGLSFSCVLSCLACVTSLRHAHSIMATNHT